jgi:hypothetical protein
VAVEVVHADAGHDGWIRWSDAEGRWAGDRRLSSQAPDCTEIAANLAFAVAVQIQLLAMLAPVETESAVSDRANPSPAPPNDGASPPEPHRTSAPGTAPTDASRLALSMGLGPSLALGVAPRTTWLGRIFANGRLSWLSVEAAFDAALPARQSEADGSGFSLYRYAACAAACGHAGAFAACLTSSVGGVGVLEARGFGVDDPSSSSGLFSQVGARVTATQELGGGYFAAARLDGLLMLSPWAVTLDESTIWTTPRLSTLVGIDLGAELF